MFYCRNREVEKLVGFDKPTEGKLNGPPNYRQREVITAPNGCITHYIEINCCLGTLSAFNVSLWL